MTKPKKTTTKYVTGRGLLAELKKIRTKTEAVVVVETVPQFRMKDDDGNEFPYKMVIATGDLTKRSVVVCVLCADYAEEVNKRRKADRRKQDFVPAPRAWGERYKTSPIIGHGAKAYLEVQFHHAAVEFRLNGSPMTPDETAELTAFLPAGVEGARQKVKSPVVIRTYNIDSIREVRIGDKVLKVKA